MSQKAVKKITITIGNTTYKVLEAPPNHGTSRAAIEVSDFDDAVEVKIPHPRQALAPMKFVLADDGTGVPPDDAGAIVSAVVVTTYTDGTTESTVTNTIAGFFSKVEPTVIQHGGERRPAWDCEFTPSGSTSTTTTTTTTTTPG